MSIELQSKKHPKSKIAHNILATQFAYASKEKEVEKLERMDVADGTIVLSDMYEETNVGKFRATVFIDRKNKQITYAVAGTRVHQDKGKIIADIKDDVMFAAGATPIKIKSMQVLNKMLIEGLMDAAGNEPNARANALAGYEINFTGHSLGGVIADCAAADMVLQMNKCGLDPRKSSFSSVTFDNPGAAKLVKSVCKKYKGGDISAVKQYIDYKAFNNRENFINTLYEQVGEKFTIVPDNQKPLNSFSCMCGYIARKCKSIPVIRSIFRALSRGQLKQQAKEHSLKNFDDVLSKGNGYVRSSSSERLMSIEEVTTGKEPLKYDADLFKLLKGPSTEESKSPKKPLYFSMLDPVTYERIEFSYEKLTQVVRTRKNSLDSETASLSGQTVSKKSFMQILSPNKDLKKFHTKKEYVQRSGEDIIEIEQKRSRQVR